MVNVMKKIPSVLNYKDAPVIDFAKGVHTRFVISKEAHNSELFTGYWHLKPDLDDVSWDAEGELDETFYCVKGSILFLWENKEGINGEIRGGEGDFIYLPSGFKYTLRATGEESIIIFSGAPNDPAIPSDYKEKLKKLGERLHKLEK